MKPELLAPAGDFQCLAAAINAGADAVYFGLSDFNMRARAQNFKITDLPKIKQMCESSGVKRYLTLNTIIYDNELNQIEKLIKKVKPYINAIICSDISVMMLCKKNKIDFHVSTQASVSNSETARFYKKLGAQRIILARELNLKQIKKIAKIINIECFIHGAMCVAESGRCFTSQFLFNESANRGKCLHPCRRTYFVKDNEGNELKVINNQIFSAKDLCTLPFIEKLKKAKIKAFKIEGRAREPEYVDTVVRVYRKALDKKLNKQEIENSINELNKVYNKGFSSGFYLKLPTSDDFSKSEDSSSTQSKKFIGKITHYYDKINVASIKINADGLKLGDEILVLGDKTGIIRAKITSIQINHKPITEAKKSHEIAIKLPFCKKNDDVYKIIKR